MATKNPIISVIVPIYRVEPYIRQCVDSILCQTYPNLEIILVDDGSPDACGQICDDYARRDSRLTVIHKANGGLSDARNAALERAGGDYIGFVDSDDWVDGDMFETLLSLALRHDAQISVCGSYEVTDRRVSLPPAASDADGERVWSRRQALEELIRDRTIKSHVWDKLFRRELFDGVRFPKGRLYEDVFMMHEVFGQADRVAFSPEPKYYYRTRGDSIVGASDYRAMRELYQAHLARTQWLRNNCPALLPAEQAVRLQTVLYVFNLAAYLPLRTYRQALKNELTDAEREMRQGGSAGFETLPTRKRVQAGLLTRAPLLFWMAERLTAAVRTHPALAASAGAAKRAARCLFRRPAPLALPAPAGKKRAFLLGMPEYNNLGDHAIAYAEGRFFQHELPEYETVEITESAFRAGRRRIRRALRSGDVVALPGGGNLGNQYPDQEAIRRWVIRHCRKNRVVVFPQTMYFTPDEAGKREAEKTAAIYNAHPDLILFAREKVSFEAMKRLFPRCRVALTPDIVLSLRPEIPPVGREGVGVCLRGDLESRVTPAEFTRITALCRESGGSVKHFDTCLADSVPAARREAALRQIWRKFAGCRLVVTDRLHGVIFAAITGTPCVAVGNYNHKVRGICEWIADLGYIRFVDRAADIPAVLSSMPGGGACRYDPDHFAPLFAPIGRLIRQPQMRKDDE